MRSTWRSHRRFAIYMKTSKTVWGYIQLVLNAAPKYLTWYVLDKPCVTYFESTLLSFHTIWNSKLRGFGNKVELTTCFDQARERPPPPQCASLEFKIINTVPVARPITMWSYGRLVNQSFLGSRQDCIVSSVLWYVNVVLKLVFRFEADLFKWNQILI